MLVQDIGIPGLDAVGYINHVLYQPFVRNVDFKSGTSVEADVSVEI